MTESCRTTFPALILSFDFFMSNLFKFLFKYLSPLSILFLLSPLFVGSVYASGSHPPIITLPPPPPVTACPNNYVGVIQKIDTDNVIRCYGAKPGMGFATNGLRQICGPVLCPMEQPHDNLARGQSCIRQDSGGACHPGTGASGFFNAASDPNTCTANTSVKVPCPPSLPLFIKGVDEAGNPVHYGTIKLAYNDAPPTHIQPKTSILFMQNADSNGILAVTGLLYAGDHFTITPIGPDGTEDKTHMIGNGYKFFDQEVDTPFSCGTKTNPCTVTIVYKPPPAGPISWFVVVLIVILVGLFLKYVARVV